MKFHTLEFCIDTVGIFRAKLYEAEIILNRINLSSYGNDKIDYLRDTINYHIKYGKEILKHKKVNEFITEIMQIYITSEILPPVYEKIHHDIWKKMFTNEYLLKKYIKLMPCTEILKHVYDAFNDNEKIEFLRVLKLIKYEFAHIPHIFPALHMQHIYNFKTPIIFMITSFIKHKDIMWILDSDISKLMTLKDSLGENILHYCTLYNYKLAKLLLDNGIEPVVDNLNLSPIHYCVYRGDLRYLKLLLRYPVNNLISSWNIFINKEYGGECYQLNYLDFISIFHFNHSNFKQVKNAFYFLTRNTHKNTLKNIITLSYRKNDKKFPDYIPDALIFNY